MSVSYNRAVMSGGLWFAVAYGVGMAVGANPDLYNTALDAGIMAGSAVGADLLHGMLGWNPTGVTSAVATGGMYAGMQKLVRGDNNLLVNAGFAGANDMLVEKWSLMSRQSAQAQAMASEYDE
jgi:hypothetical protein